MNILAYLFDMTKELHADTMSTKEPEARLSKNEVKLKQYLNKYQKKILLRILDDKDLISETISINRFIDGLRIGLMIGMESQHRYKGAIPQDE